MGNLWSGGGLEEENKKLRAEITKLRAEIREVRRAQAATKTTSPVRVSSVSRDHLLAWMDERIAIEEPDPDNWIPDALERQLLDYKRQVKEEVFMMMLDTFDHILETTKIEFMGHVISFDLAQLEPSSPVASKQWIFAWVSSFLKYAR